MKCLAGCFEGMGQGSAPSGKPGAAQISEDPKLYTASSSAGGPGARQISRQISRQVSQAEESSRRNMGQGNSSSSSSVVKRTVPSGATDTTLCAPEHLYSAFDASLVQPFEEGRFKLIKKLCDATRNQGVVQLMQDLQSDQLVAVKKMPNTWIMQNHEAFCLEHPKETEKPWQDIGCTHFLNSIDFSYGCQLLGVYRSSTYTYVVTSFATEGDLFDHAQVGVSPGPERELELAPIVAQLLTGILALHEMQISHRDLSLENVLLTCEKSTNSRKEIRIIDYGMASSTRYWSCISGKPSYQAPEMHEDKEYDAFLSDAFAVGVILYALLLKDYPWLTTRPGGCKCWGYVKEKGFRAYFKKRTIRGSNVKVLDAMSEPLTQLLEGLFAIDPAERLSLGEKSWDDSRKSIWDEPWMKSCIQAANKSTEK